MQGLKPVAMPPSPRQQTPEDQGNATQGKADEAINVFEASMPEI
jgi:hypothetical protein